MTKEKARTQLERLTQGNRPVDEFNTIIFPIIVDADIEDEMEIIRQYRRAIKLAIRRRIEDLDRSIRPKTLVEWMGKAKEIDNDWRAYNEDNKDRVSKGKSSPNTPHPYPPVLSSTPSAHLNKMSTTDRSKCIQEGLCFRCRQKGHVASDLTFHPDYRPSQRTPFQNPLRVQASNT